MVKTKEASNKTKESDYKIVCEHSEGKVTTGSVFVKCLRFAHVINFVEEQMSPLHLGWQKKGGNRKEDFFFPV